MKKLRIMTSYHEVRRDPQAYIELNTQPWIVQASSMPPEGGGGLTPPWYSTKYAIVLMDEDWTEGEATAYIGTFRSRPVVLELNDDGYKVSRPRIRRGRAACASRTALRESSCSHRCRSLSAVLEVAIS